MLLRDRKIHASGIGIATVANINGYTVRIVSARKIRSAQWQGPDGSIRPPVANKNLAREQYILSGKGAI